MKFLEEFLKNFMEDLSKKPLSKILKETSKILKNPKEIFLTIFEKES